MSKKGSGKEILIGIFVTVVGGLLLFFAQKPFDEKEPVEVRVERENPTKVLPKESIEQVTVKFIEWYNQKIANIYRFYIEGDIFITPHIIEDDYDILTDKQLARLEKLFLEDDKINRMKASEITPETHYELREPTIFRYGHTDKPYAYDYAKNRVVTAYYIQQEDLERGNGLSIVDLEGYVDKEDRTSRIYKQPKEDFDRGVKLWFIIENNRWKIYNITGYDTLDNISD